MLEVAMRKPGTSNARSGGTKQICLKMTIASRLMKRYIDMIHLTDSADSQEASADCGRQRGTESEIWMLWKQLVVSHIYCESGVCESAGEMYRNCYLCLKKQKWRIFFSASKLDY